MGKRIFSAFLAVVLLLIMLPQSTRAASSMKTSEELIALIKEFEGFSGVPYVDSDGKYTIGYGTRCPDALVAQYQETPMTEEQADTELRAVLIGYENSVNQFIDQHGLPYEQRQFDALISLIYNIGGSWLSKGETLVSALTSGAGGNELIYAFSIYSMSGGVRSIGHVRRRLAEAAVYLEGVYSRTVPENYCYVLYDAQGGKISAMGGTYNVQGYDGALTAEPVATASRTGYVFQGWFTEKTEGTQVTVLDMTTKGATLYARWELEQLPVNPDTPTDPSEPSDSSQPSDTTAPSDSDAATEPDVPTDTSQPEGEPITPVEVTVTVNALHIRKGPGADYESLGMVSLGDTLTVTEVYQGTDYLWGRTEKGWIALENTDYQKETEPTDPPATETTDPPATQTEPSVTEPVTEPTVPEEPIPEGETITPVEVTVKVKALHIRKGPGTDYDSVGVAARGDVFTVSSVYQGEKNLWGKTEQGWIALENTDYEEVSQPLEDPTQPQPSEPEEETQAPVETEPVVPPDPEMPPEGMALYATVVNTGSLNVRQEPGGSVVTVLRLGDRVRVLEQKYASDGLLWGRLEQGWVRLGAYVKLETLPLEEEPEELPPEEDLPQENPSQELPEDTRLFASVVHNGAVAVYAAPGGQRVGSLAPGDRVEIISLSTVGEIQWAQCGLGWICIRPYVKLEYVPLEQASGVSALEQTGTATRLTATATQTAGMSVYATPNGETVATAAGTKELLECRVDGQNVWGLCDEGWLRLDADVELAVVSTEGEASGARMLTVSAVSLNFRQSPGNNTAVVCRLSQGMTVDILEMRAVNGIIWANTDFGWVNMDYVTRVR